MSPLPSRRLLFLTPILLFTASIAAAQDDSAPPEPPTAAATTDSATTDSATTDSATTDSDSTTPSATTPASPPAPTLSDMTLASDANTLWTCLAAFLVFFMQAGFTLVEAGLTRAKNACNIVMKNVMDFSMGTLTFWLVGFGLMFGASKGWYGTDQFMYSASSNFDWAFLIFQTVFCATAATIVSGAMAERTKFVGYLCYTVVITVIVYPIFGAWAWGGLAGLGGGGWLEGGENGLLEKLAGAGAVFHDFAGSTVVHSIGGWCALAGALVLGPRIGKYSGKRINAIPGHNIPMAALGVFILWLGWFGFNPGSTTAVGGGDFAYIAVTTNLAAAAGAVGAMFASWIKFRKPDPSFTLNGALAGLVAITAGCDAMRPHYAILTGAIAGIIVVLAVMMFDKLRIDDPVGAISVHGICGAWGTLAIGLFQDEAGFLVGGGTTQLIAQVVGIVAAFAWAFPVSLTVFYVIHATIGLRVSEQEEIEGLDVHEHGMHAYPASLIAEGAVGPAAPAISMSKADERRSPVPSPSTS